MYQPYASGAFPPPNQVYPQMLQQDPRMPNPQMPISPQMAQMPQMSQMPISPQMMPQMAPNQVMDSATTIAMLPKNERPSSLTLAQKLRQNRGKKVIVHTNLQQFKGAIETAEEQFLIIFEQESKMRTLIVLSTITFVQFLEELRGDFQY